MKVLFPLLSDDELALDLTQALHVGFYETEDCTLEILSIEHFLQNNITRLLETIILNDVRAVVSFQFNASVLNILKKYAIEAYLAHSGDITENIYLFSSGQLLKCTQAIMPRKCGSGCDTCSVECDPNMG